MRRWLAVVSMFAWAAACEVDDSSMADTGSASGSGSSTGSGSSGTGAPRLLAPYENWVPVADPATDPFPGHRPADATCDLGFVAEDGTFEIDSELCTYALFEQPTLVDVSAGETITFNVIHDQLYAEQPATAHVVFALVDTVVHETEIPIPSDYGFIDADWIPDQDIPEGTMLRLHLHNHGVNNYRTLDIKVR